MCHYTRDSKFELELNNSNVIQCSCVFKLMHTGHALSAIWRPPNPHHVQRLKAVPQHFSNLEKVTSPKGMVVLLQLHRNPPQWQCIWQQTSVK